MGFIFSVYYPDYKSNMLIVEKQGMKQSRKKFKLSITLPVIIGY